MEDESGEDEEAWLAGTDGLPDRVDMEHDTADDGLDHDDGAERCLPWTAMGARYNHWPAGQAGFSINFFELRVISDARHCSDSCFILTMGQARQTEERTTCSLRCGAE